jgi:CubicO group peptidase (beta-lactamase class C family)
MFKADMKHFTILFILIALYTSNTGAQIRNVESRHLLMKMTAAIEHNEYSGVHSLLIKQGLKPIYEGYFHGYKQDSLHDTRSAFKSVTSLLVGIAVDKGLIRSLDQKVYELFPEYKPFKNDDPRKKMMTIRNLLEMKSGFDCEEFDGTKDCEDVMSESRDWVKFSLDLPMKCQPGTEWSYTSIAPMILSGVISKVSGMTVMDFAKKYLFAPMGMTDYKWTTDLAGHGMTAGSFYIKPADMLKLAELVLQQGKWNGKQLISQKWIAESTAGNIPISGFSYVGSSRTAVAIPQQAYYGYYWYHELIKTNAFQHDLLFASGNGGQYIFIIKSLDLAIVFTQGNYGSWRAKQAFEILAKYIIPALIR